MNRMLFYNDKTERAAGIRDYLERIRKERPVVQCITNIVTVNDCANALLAIGASPTMAHHPHHLHPGKRGRDSGAGRALQYRPGSGRSCRQRD